LIPVINPISLSDFLIREVIKPGVRCSDIYDAAIERSQQTDFHEAFLKFGNGETSILAGHGVGMEVNEPPVISENSKQEIAEDKSDLLTVRSGECMFLSFSCQAVYLPGQPSRDPATMFPL